MLDSLLATIAPHYCLQCGSLGSLWCVACANTAPATALRCYRCHRLMSAGRTCQACRKTSALYSVMAATRYEQYPKRLVWKIKFVRAYAGAGALAGLMAARCQLPEGCVVVPAPTSTTRVRQRGYDQAVLLARRFARLTGTPYAPALQRLGRQQQRMAARAQRLTQLQGAFVVVRAGDVTGKHVVLVDDVITTGATLEAAARALKVAGARRVSAVVFAQA